MLTKWDERRIKLLTKLWAEGKSATIIGRDYFGGLSRNAIIGKAHRLRLAARKMGAKPGPTRRERVVAEKKPKIDAVPASPPPNGVSFLELSHPHCREIIGWDNVSGFNLARYCGGQRIVESSYCHQHHMKNYQPTRPYTRKR